MEKAKGKEYIKNWVAAIGDSTFLHTGINQDLTCSSITGSNSSTIYNVSTFEANSSISFFGSGLTIPSSYMGVNGGLVIVVADDPGLYSSQNEQDTRMDWPSIHLHHLPIHYTETGIWQIAINATSPRNFVVFDAHFPTFMCLLIGLLLL